MLRATLRATIVARPELDKARGALRTGDALLCWRLDRLGRTVLHLLKLAEELRERGVELRSLQDGIDTSTAAGKMCFTFVAAVAEMESLLNSERTREGIRAARRRWGKPGFFDDEENVRAAQAMLRHSIRAPRCPAKFRLWAHSQVESGRGAPVGGRGARSGAPEGFVILPVPRSPP